MRFTSESRSIRFHQHGYKLNGNIVLLIHSHDSSLRASSLYASWLLATRYVWLTAVPQSPVPASAFTNTAGDYS
jgi:hypothetical protein